MFSNLVNAHDIAVALRQPRRLGGLVASGRRDRVRASWSHLEGKPIHWFDVPAVRDRMETLASGRHGRGHVEYLVTTHLAGRGGLRGLSLGCGTGRREATWARTGLFSRLDAYDISEPRIRAATAYASREGLEALSFHVADAHEIVVPDDSLDVIIVEDALHHFPRVDALVARFRRWLRSGGLLFLHEYVGPRRFQWSGRQIEAAESLLMLLPPRYRMPYGGTRPRTRIVRPSRLRMRLLDPSEAVESDRIVPAVRAHLQLVEERPLGGTVTNLVLQDIAYHFAGDDPDANAYLNVAFSYEDAAIAAGDLQSDHALLVARCP